MRTLTRPPRLAGIAPLALAALVNAAGCSGGGEAAGARGSRAEAAVPVETAPVVRGPIELRRVFTGTLEARSEFVLAAKVAGRVEEIAVDLADPVRRGQVVVRLDDAELRQAVAQAEAERAVARARLTEAGSAAEIADRELERVRTLRARGIASESRLDEATADALTRAAGVEVARAQLARAEASLETARIRLGYTRVVATWSGGDDERVVAERHSDEGMTVGAGDPLLSIVELDPLQAVVFATERDYGMLRAGQPVTLSTDAYPGERFPARVERVAPVFRPESRQARVELAVPNEGGRLKPGLFVRAETVLDRVEDATVMPLEALVRRDGRDAVFVLGPGASTVALRPVEVGIQDGARVQVRGEGLAGRVVVLGQQLLDDGSSVVVTDRAPAAPAAPAPALAGADAP